MKKWLPAFLVYLFLTLADGGLTLYNTPDLSMEANPLVTHFNLGWGALITANSIALIIVLIACRFTFYKYNTYIADVPDMKSYISQLFYNRPDKFVWTFYKFPKNWKPLWAWMSYALYFGLCAGRIVTDLEWVFATLNFDMSGYNSFCIDWFFGRFDIAVALIVLIVSLFVWFRKEYKKSLSQVTEKSMC